jgi:hypothetical protein
VQLYRNVNKKYFQMLCKILDEPNGSHFQRKDVSNAVVFGSRRHQTDKLIRNYRDTIMIQLKLKT